MDPQNNNCIVVWVSTSLARIILIKNTLLLHCMVWDGGGGVRGREGEGEGGEGGG